MPALFTRTSMGPASDSARASAAAIPSPSVTSNAAVKTAADPEGGGRLGAGGEAGSAAGGHVAARLLNQAPAPGGGGRGLGGRGKAGEPLVEGARRGLAPRRHGELDVIEAHHGRLVQEQA